MLVAFFRYMTCNCGHMQLVASHIPSFSLDIWLAARHMTYAASCKSYCLLGMINLPVGTGTYFECWLKPGGRLLKISKTGTKSRFLICSAAGHENANSCFPALYTESLSVGWWVLQWNSHRSIALHCFALYCIALLRTVLVGSIWFWPNILKVFDELQKGCVGKTRADEIQSSCFESAGRLLWNRSPRAFDGTQLMTFS